MHLDWARFGILRKGLGLALGTLLVLAAMAEDSPSRNPQPLESTNIHNLFRVTERIYSGSQPEGDAAYRELARLGVKTIVSVDGAKPEVEAAKRQGLRYVHLPFGYDSVPSNRVVELSQAIASVPGPVFVHCHHGKHRGPTAVAVMCLAAESWTSEQAAAWLKQAGTSPDYRGLYQSVATFRPPDAVSLASVGPLPEVAPPSTVVAAMVSVDNHLEQLKAVQNAGWRPPVNHPDLVPAQAALLLWEQLKELARHSDTQARPAEYTQMLTHSEAAAERLHTLLSNSAPPNPPDREAALENLIKSCSACHKAYRN